MISDRISEITQRWFLTEEVLFLTFCTHRIAENSEMNCHVRVGKGVIEVNPSLCNDTTDKELEERLQVEMVRILLKHPYERQPEGCSLLARALGSNCVIGDSYILQRMEVEQPSDFDLPPNGHYEFYARQIEQLKNNQIKILTDDNVCNEEFVPPISSKKSDRLESLAENWEQDELMPALINDLISNCTQASWGSLPGKLVEQIQASTAARIDYRKVLAGFRTSIITQNRRLTRMRPNRRSGFDAMGNRYNFTTRLVIGVDCSGSITHEDLQNFYSTINRFFQYGITQIDVLQFDTELSQVEIFSKVSSTIKVTGRGGTSFQPFMDFLSIHPEYDGAIIYTDGYAPPPTIPSTLRTQLCWVLRSEKELKIHEEWMRKSGRVCVIENI